ncbi:molybdopterin-dependent oxidoreductase [Plasticicumulans acidivorans]|uniref:Oxidoreductase molybdopterin-binding domain-containing protein n=1 Tax=Plasticicumulans acidivorans TaxID=886464 RepID=A0A317MSD6_9GAMM|nr:molybdopterin-dependent oxidoreductase [Plasticicumulans acidivorans]PWV59876.1 hypothetical protein C7443_109129 [Plasticicumulans acidivorans]
MHLPVIPRSRLRPALAALLLGTSSLLHAAPTTSEFSLSGDVLNPGTYQLDDLLALPAVSESVSYGTGHGPVSAEFTGASLWSLLQAAGIKVDAAVKNDLISKYVVATGSDGYRAVYSIAELSPQFGGSGTPALVAYTMDGAALGSSGFARTTAPGDAAGGRYVSNLASLQVFDAPAAAVSGGGVSSAFTLDGTVSTALSFDLAALQSMSTVTEAVSYVTSKGTVSATFTGVPLWSLLTMAGIVSDPDVKNDLLGKVLIATGSDGYQAVFSLAELDPAFGGNASLPIMVAFEMDGALLTDDGFARLVVPEDIAGGRYVSNLVSLQLIDAPRAVPVPGTLGLAVLGLGLLGRRRARRLH